MHSLNSVHLLGRLGRDPEMRYTPEGQPVTTLSLATDRLGAHRTSETDWHRVVFKGRLAEVANQYLARGRLVYLAGRLTYRQWKDAKGQSRQITEVVGAELVLLDRRPDATPPTPADEQVGDDDLPF